MKTNCLWQTGTSDTTCADCNIAFQQLLCCCNRVWGQAKHGMFRQTYCHCLCLQPAKTGWDRTFLFLLLLLNVRVAVLSRHILCTFFMFVVIPLLYKHNITVGIHICIMAHGAKNDSYTLTNPKNKDFIIRHNCFKVD